MQDNAAVHTAAVVTKHPRDEGIESIAWPPYSPDLNTIESIWSAITIFIYSRYGESDGER